jgi:hypothetical protein
MYCFSGYVNGEAGALQLACAAVAFDANFSRRLERSFPREGVHATMRCRSEGRSGAGPLEPWHQES